MDIGKRITFYRTTKNYTVNKLANLSGISQSYLRDVELGNKNPTVETLSYVCDALGISLADFFAEETSQSIKEEPLLAKIYQLTPQQKASLLSFLDSMTT